MAVSASARDHGCEVTTGEDYRVVIRAKEQICGEAVRRSVAALPMLHRRGARS